MSSNQTDAEERNFRQKDYELKVTYLSNHFTRMWNRFNYFVAIETALIGGKLVIPNGQFLAIVGILMSIFWYVMGAEDRYLVHLYRCQVEKAANEVTKTILTDQNARNSYHYIGQVEENSEDKQKWKRFAWLGPLSGWRWEPISTTRLAVLFPLVVLALWVVIIFFIR